MSKPQLVLVRAFPTDIERTGPRQLTGRLVPYDEPTEVLDILPDGEPDLYTEGIRPGAFAAQANAGEKRFVAKIGLIHRHEGGLGFLGPFRELREEPDGLYGDATILRSKENDVEDLLAEGIDGLSVEFRVPKANGTEIGADGIRWRTRAHLDQVALEPVGAYERAQVLAYRAAVDEETSKAAAEAEAEAERARTEAARKARWDEMSARLDVEKQRQAELVREYGFTQPGGFGTV